MSPIHVALVIGVDEELDPAQPVESTYRGAAEEASRRLGRQGAFVRACIGSEDQDPPGSTLPASQVQIARALDDLVACARQGARVTIVYCGHTYLHPTRGPLLRADDTPLEYVRDMWSVDDLQALFDACPGTAAVVVSGTTGPLPDDGLQDEEVEWPVDSNGLQVFDITDLQDVRVGYLVLTGISYSTQRWSAGKDYWFWTSGLPWPDHFRLKWAEGGNTDDDRFNGLTTPDVYAFSSFAWDESSPPAQPSGKLYRVTRVVGQTTTLLHLYLNHVISGSTRTTEWWGANAVLTQDNLISLPLGHTHQFDRINNPPVDPPTDRHIAPLSSG